MDEQYHSKFRTNAKFSLIFFFSLLSHLYFIIPICLTHSLSLSRWSPPTVISSPELISPSACLCCIRRTPPNLAMHRIPLFVCLFMVNFGDWIWYEKWDCSSIGLLFWGGGVWWWFWQVVLGWFWVMINGGGFVDLVGSDLVLGFDLAPLSLFLWLSGGCNGFGLGCGWWWFWCSDLVVCWVYIFCLWLGWFW